MKQSVALFTAVVTGLATAPVAFATNLLTNGDFNQGNSGFSSGYGYIPPPGVIQDPGTYCVASDATQCHPKATSFPDDTGDNGPMLVANGSDQPDLAIWRELVSVTAGTTYTFSGAATTWSTGTDPSPPQLHVEIGGQQVGADFDVPATNGQWASFGGTWTATATGPVAVEIFDLNLDFAGNDVALDDLALVEGVVVPPSAAEVAAIVDDMADSLNAIKLDSVDYAVQLSGLPTLTPLDPNCTAGCQYTGPPGVHVDQVSGDTAGEDQSAAQEALSQLHEKLVELGKDEVKQAFPCIGASYLEAQDAVQSISGALNEASMAASNLRSTSSVPTKIEDVISHLVNGHKDLVGGFESIESVLSTMENDCGGTPPLAAALATAEDIATAAAAELISQIESPPYDFIPLGGWDLIVDPDVGGWNVVIDPHEFFPDWEHCNPGLIEGCIGDFGTLPPADFPDGLEVLADPSIVLPPNAIGVLSNGDLEVKVTPGEVVLIGTAGASGGLLGGIIDFLTQACADGGCEVAIFAASDLVPLGKTHTDDQGGFSLSVTIPSDLPAGQHLFEVDVVAPDGRAVVLVRPFEVVQCSRILDEGGEVGGCVPPSAPTAKCEDELGVLEALLTRRLLKCEAQAATKGLAGVPFDAAGCEAAAQANYAAATERLQGCPDCMDMVSIGQAIASDIRGPTSAALYCAGANPLGDGGDGNVPPDGVTGVCENKAGKALGVLTQAVIKCQRKLADAETHQKSFDVAGCDAKVAMKFATATQKLHGCPACLANALGTMGDTREAEINQQGGQRYCDQ